MLSNTGLLLFRTANGETPKCSDTRLWDKYDAEQRFAAVPRVINY